MAKSPMEGRRIRLAAGRVRAAGNVRLIVAAVSAACLATASAAVLARNDQTDRLDQQVDRQVNREVKQDGAADALPVPLCTAGILASKDGDDALGMYDVGGGQALIDWTDAAAKDCAKATGSGLRLNIAGVSMGLTQVGQNPLMVYKFTGGVREFGVKLLEPGICESYDSSVSPLKLALEDTNAADLVFYGIESLRYSIVSGGIEPVLTEGEFGPLLRCHAVTAANAPLPRTDVLFDGGFERSADLRVDFLDAQGNVLAATGNDQFIQQPTAFANGITYQVRVTNDGDGPATDVRVREFAPLAGGSITPNVSLSGCGPNPTGSAAYCPGGDGLLYDDIETLAAGASQLYTVTRKAQASGARTSVAVFSDPDATVERTASNNARSLRINLINNQAPNTVGSIANLSKAEGESLNIATAANFSDPEGATLSYSATGLPAGTSINTSTGVISGVLGFDTHAVYNVTVTASDGSLSADQSFTLTVTDANGAPTTAATLQDVEVSEGDLLEISTAQGFADPDSDILTYDVNGLPAEYANFFSPATGNIFVPALSSTSAGTYEVTVVASDGTLTVDQTFTLTINNVNTVPTVVSAIANQSNDEGDEVDLDVTGAFGDVDSDTLLLTVEGALPTGLSFDDGVFTGTIAYTAAVDGSPYSITVTADDQNGGTVSDTFTWTIADQNGAPEVAETLGDVTRAEGALLNLQTAPGFSDPDGDDLSFDIDGLPAGMLYDPDTGQIFDTLEAGTAGEYDVTVTASDGEFSEFQTFTLTVTAP